MEGHEGILPFIAGLRSQGANSLRAMAAGLNEAGSVPREEDGGRRLRCKGSCLQNRPTVLESQSDGRGTNTPRALEIQLC